MKRHLKNKITNRKTRPNIIINAPIMDLIIALAILHVNKANYQLEVIMLVI